MVMVPLPSLAGGSFSSRVMNNGTENAEIIFAGDVTTATLFNYRAMQLLGGVTVTVTNTLSQLRSTATLIIEADATLPPATGDALEFNNDNGEFTQNGTGVIEHDAVGLGFTDMAATPVVSHTNLVSMESMSRLLIKMRMKIQRRQIRSL